MAIPASATRYLVFVIFCRVDYEAMAIRLWVYNDYSCWPRLFCSVFVFECFACLSFVLLVFVSVCVFFYFCSCCSFVCFVVFCVVVVVVVFFFFFCACTRVFVCSVLFLCGSFSRPTFVIFLSFFSACLFASLCLFV